MIKLVDVPSLYCALQYAVSFCKEHDGQVVNIIVPDKLSLFMERYLFENMHISASFNIKINTLNRFVKKGISIDSSKQISNAGSVILINKILDEHSSDFVALKNNRFSFSYAEEISKTISQLKASRITPDEMLSFSSANKALQAKIHDIGLIYKLYETQKAGLLDASDEFLYSAINLEDKNYQNILFVGFDDFTSIEYVIIERLSNKSSVYITNYKGTGSNKHLYNSSVAHELRQMAYTCGLQYENIVYTPQLSGLKQFLHTNLLGYRSSAYTLDKEPIKIYSGKNLEDEFEFVARDIRQNILQGKSYADFGIAVFGLEENKQKFKQILEKYDINAYFDVKFALNDSIFYKFLLSVLKFNIESYNLVHLIDLLNSPFCPINNDKKSAIINKLLIINFQGKNLTNIDFGDDLVEEKQALLNFISLFTLDKADSITDFISMITNANNAIGLQSKLEEISLNASLDSRVLICKSYQSIINLLENIKQFYFDAEIIKIYDIFMHISSIVKINNLPLTIDAVKVVDANDCVEIFNNLYLVGCDASHAPSIKSDCGIIQDCEIEQFDFSHKLAPTIAHINRLAKLRLFNIALLFNDSLSISYSNTPSELVKDLLSKIKVKFKDADLPMIALNNQVLHNNMALSDWDYVSKCMVNKYVDKNFEKILKNNKKITKNSNLTSISKQFLNIFDNITCISPTYLENYFKCPFYAFMSNIIKIHPRTQSDLQAFDVGNILHEVVYRYYKLKKNIADTYEFVKQEVYKYLEKDERTKLNIKSSIISNLIDEGVRIIQGLNYIDQNSKFIPSYFEHSFDSQTSLQLKNVSIHGKIDRVDKFNDDLRIIDYKSGKADASIKELYYGNKLQLFLYSLAIENETNKKVLGSFYLPLHNNYVRNTGNSYTLKGFYVNEKDNLLALDKRVTVGYSSDIVNISTTKNGLASKRGNKALEYEEMARLKNYATLVSEQAFEEIKSGYICPSPSEISDPCEYCPYVQLCMKNSNGFTNRCFNKVTLDSFKRGEE